MFPGFAKVLMITGGILFLAGLVFYFAGNKLGWFGKLPGDIRVERENFSFFAPITSMILVSVLLTFIMFLFRKFRG